MIYSKIAGTGKYLPDHILTNKDLEEIVDTSDDWIKSRTGVEKRHIASDDQSTSDLAYEAAKIAIRNSSINLDEIDLIIVGTCTPDLVFPNTATLVQEKLGIGGCPAFSLETACSGFIYAAAVADKFIKVGEAKCALVIGADCLSRLLDWTDRSTCVLFGDGAGAVILKPSSESGIISCHLGSDGQYKDLLCYPIGPSKDLHKAGSSDAKLLMSGNEVFKVAVRTLGKLAEKTLRDNDIDQEKLDWLVPHQANMRIIKATAKRLKLPLSKVILTVQDHGNSSSASIPMALDVGIEDGRIQRGQLILMEGFGGGFTWGSILMRY
ncbi:MAG: 3-oxoacyl-ACP synthase [Gammaproteobacteria bacterium]|nr:3-oxoacyl-ACP synthase [Gammaproteobacteria bacterium]|tara:strand:- start:1751 stop:2719 length:969 start_codon:yes stop_codon:yes gene_type:complete